MANFLKIIVGTNPEDFYHTILNYDVIENIQIKDPGAIEIYSGKVFIQLEIIDGLGATNLKTTKIALQTIFDTIQILPGGRIVEVNFPKGIRCENFSITVIG